MARSAFHEIHPLDTLWHAQSLIWTVLLGEAVALVLALAPGLAAERLLYFSMASFVIQWILLTSLGVLYVSRKWLARMTPPVIAYLGLAALLTCTWLVCWLGWLTLRELWIDTRLNWITFGLQLTGISLTVGLLGLAAFQTRWRSRQFALRAKQAELEALQARLRPHFLFNTINTGISLVHARPDAAEQLLLDLSDLFRAAISSPVDVPLEEEISLARRYLEIESLRFGSRLKIGWNLPLEPSTISSVMLPILSIQPLVENAIRHGIEPSVAGGWVVIGIHVDTAGIHIVVRNSLPEHAHAVRSGYNVGLAAVRARIEAFTDGRGKVETEATSTEFVATMTLPINP